MSDKGSGGFECVNCGQWVPINDFIGTKNRNHCQLCLWSKHVDGDVAGDRSAGCHGKMKPVGLTFKQAGEDKYGKPRQGELMIIHECTKCGKVSINRIAGDDKPDEILKLLDSEELSDDKRSKLADSGIEILNSKDADRVRVALFGKN